MTIRNMKNFISGIWDWGFLDQCFPGTKIRVTDIDGFVERNGNFLVLEAKQPGLEIPKGQRILFENMQKTGLFTVVVVWGKKNAVEALQVYYPGYDKPNPKKPATNENLQRIVKWWSNHASSTKLVSFKEVGS
jgi:hypothetical protein